VAALREAVATRPKPKDPEHKGLLFITRYGGKWAKAEIIAADPETGTKERTRSDDPICKEFAKLLKDLGLHRPGLGFYALRQTFETIGGDSRDQVAVDAIMGHARDDMASLSRERIDDDRLRAVVDHVHRWLWPVAGTKENK
jgi:integrase